MKQTTLLIENCAKCPYIIHKIEEGISSGYYCNYNNKWIPNKVNILKDIWKDCELLDY